MMTTPECGLERRDDVASLRRFAFSDLRSIKIPDGVVTLLAIRFFLSRHADHRTHVVIVRGTNDDEEGNGGRD
jgi:hypothetical protein